MKKNRKKNKGSVLAYVLVIMSLTSIILISMIGYIVSQLNFSANRVEREKAFQIAEAGIFWYNWYLAHEISGKTAEQINNFWQEGSAFGVSSPYEKGFVDPEKGEIGKYKIEVQPPDSNSTIVRVKSTGWTNSDPENKRTIQVRFRRPSWSEFAVLANDFMRFGPGTDVFGKIHSNKGIRFDGTANNVVSSLVANYDDPDHSGAVEFGVHTHVNPPPATGVNNSFRPLEAPPNEVPARPDVFRAGRQFPIPEISFNGVLSDFSFMKNEATSPGGTNINNCTSRGCYFDSTYPKRIILRSDGTMDVCTVSSYDSSSYAITRYRRNVGNGTCTSCSGNCSPRNYQIPDNGIIFAENHLWVEGTVNNKRVTIAAANISGGPEKDIYIGYNNIRYTNLNGEDIIGLVAQNNISIIRDSQNFLTIDAALLAQSGRVGRDYYSSFYNKNTITVNGSIATNLRYGFAYTDGTGYVNRNLNFDNNLLYYPPPYFPTGTNYSIDLWEEL